MDINVYEELQDELMKFNRLCTINVETITPILIGGYDGKCYHGSELGHERLRESSIKGVWRWYVRALIAAALTKKYGNNKYVTLDVAERFASEMLGSTEKSSKYSIAIIYKRLDYLALREYSDIPRIKLLMQREDMKNEHVIAPGSIFDITVYRNRNTKREEDEFAIWSLTLSLLLDGIGKACSRGFGKVKILNISGEIVEELNNLLRKLYSSKNTEDIKINLEEIINKTIERAGKVMELYKNKFGELMNLKLSVNPLIEIPLIESGLMIIKMPRKSFNKPKDAIKAIGNATLKLNYKIFKHIKRGLDVRQARQRAMEESGRDVHTWILGLPRAQEPAIVPDGMKLGKLKQKLKKELSNLSRRGLILSEEKERELLEIIKPEKRKEKIRVRIPTGYYYIGKNRDLKLRRRSPIRFTVIKTNDNNYYVIMYAFKTYDWTQIIRFLIHVGAHYRKKKEIEKGKSKLKVIDVESFTITPIVDVNVDDVLAYILTNAKEIIEKN